MTRRELRLEGPEGHIRNKGLKSEVLNPSHAIVILSVAKDPATSTNLAQSNQREKS